MLGKALYSNVILEKTLEEEPVLIILKLFVSVIF